MNWWQRLVKWSTENPPAKPQPESTTSDEMRAAEKKKPSYSEYKFRNWRDRLENDQIDEPVKVIVRLYSERPGRFKITKVDRQPRTVLAPIDYKMTDKVTGNSWKITMYPGYGVNVNDHPDWMTYEEARWTYRMMYMIWIERKERIDKRKQRERDRAKLAERQRLIKEYCK